MPNCASPCATSRPDLVSAALGSNNDQIVFTFDKNVIVNPGAVTGFIAELENGKSIASTGATLTAPNQITATYSGDLSNRAEFAVEAAADIGTAVAADNITPSGFSLPGTANIGDNAGAFADGFTSAPDSFGVSINHTNGQVIVNLDDRISAVNAGALTLYTAQGLPIAIAPTSVSFNSSAGPGPTAVTLQYSPSGITNATALQIGQAAFVGPCPSGGTCTTAFSSNALDSQSVPQIDDPPNSAAILKAYKAWKAKQHRSTLKHHRAPPVNRPRRRPRKPRPAPPPNLRTASAALLRGPFCRSGPPVCALRRRAANFSQLFCAMTRYNSVLQAEKEVLTAYEPFSVRTAARGECVSPPSGKA